MPGPYDPPVLFGAHVSSAGGISNAIDRVEAIGGNAVQVFTQSPRMWRPTAHTEEETERFRKRRKQARVKHVACHALYLVNLASRDREIRAKSFQALCATLETARQLDADAVVFHVGSHLGYGFSEALKIVTAELRDLLELTSERLWLCVDSCHWWASGVDVTDAAALEDALGELDERIGLERIRLLHVNDAKTPLG